MTTLLNIPFAAAQMETLKKVKILVKWESRTASTGFLLKEYNQALYTADTLYKTAVDVFKTSNVIDNLQSLSPNIAKHTQLGFTQGLIKINGVIFFCYFECFQGGRNPDTDFHLYPITFFKSVIDCKHDYTVLHQHLFENTNSLCLYKVLESTNYWAIKTAFNIKSIDYMAWLVSNDKLNYFFREKGIQVVFFTNQYQDDVLDKVCDFMEVCVVANYQEIIAQLVQIIKITHTKSHPLFGQLSSLLPIFDQFINYDDLIKDMLQHSGDSNLQYNYLMQVICSSPQKEHHDDALLIATAKLLLRDTTSKIDFQLCLA